MEKICAAVSCSACLKNNPPWVDRPSMPATQVETDSTQRGGVQPATAQPRSQHNRASPANRLLCKALNRICVALRRKHGGAVFHRDDM
eukprot:3952244-Pleurochrysis_carterae.AAC.1